MKAAKKILMTQVKAAFAGRRAVEAAARKQADRKPLDRAGRRLLQAWLPDEVVQAMKRLALDERTTMQEQMRAAAVAHLHARGVAVGAGRKS